MTPCTSFALTIGASLFNGLFIVVLTVEVKKLDGIANQHLPFLALGHADHLLLHELQRIGPPSNDVGKVRRPHDSVHTDSVVQLASDWVVENSTMRVILQLLD